MLNFVTASTLGLITFAAVVLFYHHHVWKWLPSPLSNQLALGALLGLGTVQLMLVPVEIAPGLLLDARVLLMGFAGLLAGWRGAMTALLVAVPARLMMGGQGALVGCLTLTVAPATGVVWRHVEHRFVSHSLWRYPLFGLVLSLSLFTILLFPEPQRTQAWHQAMPILMAVNLFGALWAGWMEFGIHRVALQRERLHRRSLTDELTGLGNRISLTESIEKRLAAAADTNCRFALISVDFDNFKNINDTLGHKVGDALLVLIAQRFSDHVPTQGVLVRVAGDQFVVLLEHTSTKDLMAHANKLLEVARAPYQLDEYVVLLTASIGIVWAPEHGCDARLLLQNAEIAMYQSKREGRNQVTCFDPTMRAALERNASMTQALQSALASGAGLDLVFQPQFSALGRSLVGAEALLRWSDAKYGVVSPAEFIPLVEGAGLIRLLDSAVIEMAARQLKIWLSEGFELHLSINVSVLSLGAPQFADELLGQLERYGVPPALIEIEVIESQSLENSPEAGSNLERLRSAGAAIALDDFGTGHSSMSYLHQLPLTTLKIDASFVQNIVELKRTSQPILIAIIALARALHLNVIAEGVETEEQLDWLAAHGCQSVQGYLLGRAVEPQEFKQRYLVEAESKQPRA